MLLKFFRKFHKKIPILESLFNKVTGLTPILKNICQTVFALHTHTIHCYLSILLYIQHLLLHYHCYYSEAINWRCSIKMDVLRNYTKLTGKHLCQSLFFDKIAGLRSATFLKKRLWHRRFPLNFAKFLRATFVTEHLWWLLLTFVSISVCFWFKFKRLQRI